MKKLQAAIRDRSAATWRERKVMYKVGSPMKGCHNCGEVEETDSGRLRYVSGFEVFRAYRPWETKWTWKCQECLATDLMCWVEDDLGLVEAELGREPILGNREAVRQIKYALRREATQLFKDKDPKPAKQSRTQEIEALELQIKQLEELLKGGK